MNLFLPCLYTNNQTRIYRLSAIAFQFINIYKSNSNLTLLSFLKFTFIKSNLHFYTSLNVNDVVCKGRGGVRVEHLNLTRIYLLDRMYILQTICSQNCNTKSNSSVQFISQIAQFLPDLQALSEFKHKSKCFFGSRICIYLKP